MKEACRKQEIYRVEHVPSHQNPADALTKMGNCAALNNILKSGLLQLEVNQWAIRKQNEEYYVKDGEKDWMWK